MGNHILYDDGHFMRKLIVARAAILPFLALLTILVFFWARLEFGNAAGLVGAVLFTTLPIVLAFSSLVYTDIPTATMQYAALFAIRYWLEKPPNWHRSLLLGFAVSLAFLTKFTSILFLPWAALAMLACKWLTRKKSESNQLWGMKTWMPHLGIAGITAILMIALGYGFSFGHIREAMRLSTENMPSFQHFPAPLRSVARNLVISDPIVPLPSLLRGLSSVWVLKKSVPGSYLFEQRKTGGWWYFFPVGVMFKTPLPFLLLCLISVIPLWQSGRQGQWTKLTPAVSVLMIFVSTIPVGYKVGIRHVMIVFPLMAMLAGYGAIYLWRVQGKKQVYGRALLVFLLTWQLVSSLRAQKDFIAYFNELAGKEPAKILVLGCDLDCGQDLFRLSDELHARNVQHVTIALWTSAEMSQMNLPAFDTLEPFHPVTGWVAISQRAMRVGHAFHTAYPPEGFAWLNQYQPVKQVGQTILLYYIPEDHTGPSAVNSSTAH
jgi:4-amino-4-deoxy-L-arabinose transferase-like glycosyltransferase